MAGGVVLCLPDPKDTLCTVPQRTHEKNTKRNRHGALKRLRMYHVDNVQGITMNDIRRLARRGGVKRISGLLYGVSDDLYLNPSTT